MRKDVYERMRQMKQEGVKPNFAAVARQYNCDYRTVKRYYDQPSQEERKRKPSKPSKLDEFKGIVEEKLEIPATAISIFHFIRKKGYQGGYTTVKNYCREIKQEKTRAATIRFETIPGLQAQVDWKENMRLESRQGEVYEFNIFLMILGYSRWKYIELTLDRNQDTLMRCMLHACQYFEGVPKEILFDNMKTVVNQSRTQYQQAIIQPTFYEFSKTMGFDIWTCRAYRPETKGKVESLARLTERLRPYQHEFDDVMELDAIIREFNEDINREISQAIDEPPMQRFQKEKEYLNRLPSLSLIDGFLNKSITRVVSRESLVTYQRSKYSVSPRYIGKTVTLEVHSNVLHIYFSKELIQKHSISSLSRNYPKEHVVEILKSNVFKHKSDETIETFIQNNLHLYDDL